MKLKYFLLVTAMMMTMMGSGQTTISTDSTTIFKNKEGKVLSSEEAKELMKTKFSMRQENIDGKKVITIFPTDESETAKFNAKMKAFREELIGKKIESFKFADLNDKKWNSKDLKGKVVVMNFWFTGCKPCIQEMPLLNEVVAANKDKAILFIAPAPEEKPQINKFLQKYQFDYNIIPSSTNYADKLGIEVYPTHFIIDKEGVIRQVLIGYSADIKDKLQQEINKLLPG